MARYDYVLSHREVIALAFAALLCLAAGERGVAASSGGTTIDNSVSAAYTDASGRAYSTRSNTVVATVAEIAAIAVSPKESKADALAETVPVGQAATRTFAVFNGSNISDAYRITALSAGSLAVTSVKWVNAGGASTDASGGALSPVVAPGGSISIIATIATSGLSAGAQVPVNLTVQTTASGTVNGLQSDTGQEWIVGGSAPTLSGPGGSGTQVSKSVDKVTVVQSRPGATVTFDIIAVNSGGSPAQNVVVSDTVPSGLTIDASSAKIDGRPAGIAASVQGQVLSVNAGTLNAGATLDVSFDAAVPSALALGLSFVNIANISATGVPQQQTTAASVFTGSANIVFDGFSGANHPIGGAVVSLLDENGTPVPLRARTSASAPLGTFAGSGTSNPVVTGPDGTYGFALPPSQIAPAGSRFFLTIDAPGYLNRKIAIDVTPGAENQLYDVKASSLDGQPLAAAGGFTLTNTSVQLQNVFGLFGNLPVFQSNPLTVSKTADRGSAEPGDRIVYTVQFTNASPLALSNVAVLDTLDAGLVYAPGSSRLDGNADFEPVIAGRTLTWRLPALGAGAGHTLTYAAVVFPSTPSGTTLLNNVSVSGAAGASGLSEGGSASASVLVVGGMFSDRRVVTGRVFVDVRGSDRFSRGDRGVAGVRIYLEDGSYVTTDAQGLFSFPAVRPGMHVLRIDPSTLPDGLRARSPQRLLHGILDGSTMEDVEFPLQGGAR
ncbi:MAG TPA: hypothetical protein VJP85_14680 [Candidatus Baltobacteraceae bacterium]|nr:hypothetical protein [Candidatus Baltobacteraceae bacterium]